MSRSKRILFLLLINLGLVILSIYFLDMLEILDYRQIFSQIPFLKEQFVVKTENPFLLEKLELDKKWLLLEEKQRNIEDARKEIERNFLLITQQQEQLAQEKENIQNMIAEFELAKQNQATYEKRVEEIATQIENMPPKSAVQILEKQEDEMIIDVLRTIEKRAQSAGKTSIVAYLLSLMDPEQAARIQRKMVE
jgi:seryl-tRNA synthetase